MGCDTEWRSNWISGLFGKAVGLVIEEVKFWAVGEKAQSSAIKRRYLTDPGGMISIPKINGMRRRMVKIVLNVVGVLLILIGVVWFLQGINILPGSFMTGQTQWALYGAIAFVIGAGLLFYANRRKSSPLE